MNCTESFLANRLAFASVFHVGLCGPCVFLGPLMSKADPDTLGHLINVPAECQVKYEIFADMSPHPDFSWLSRWLA